MKSKTASVLLAFIAACLSKGQAADLDMLPIPEDNAVNPQIINANRRATREAWPVTLPFTSEEGARCTATAVSETAVITAAHCVGENPTAHVTLGDTRVRVTCEHHPDYDDAPRNGNLKCHLMRGDRDIVACTADIAICVTVPPKTISITEKFERIRKSAPGAVVNNKIALLGYGCLVEGGPIQKDLMEGDPVVIRVSVPGVSKAHPDRAYEEFIETGGSAACGGDSGGAGYNSTNKDTREIIGIASRGNLSTKSYLVNVLDPRIANWLTNFSGARICGIHPDAINCRF
jgi:hypothetical protein